MVKEDISKTKGRGRPGTAHALRVQAKKFRPISQ
jgi:hypothetical protein